MPTLPKEFLRGIELFNQGRFFECHEVWETIWLKASGDEREFLHAMIQAAAALHHYRQGNLKGFRTVARRAADRLEKLPKILFQVDVQKFRFTLESFLAETDATLPHITLQDLTS